MTRTVPSELLSHARSSTVVNDCASAVVSLSMGLPEPTGLPRTGLPLGKAGSITSDATIRAVRSAAKKRLRRIARLEAGRAHKRSWRILFQLIDYLSKRARETLLSTARE